MSVVSCTESTYFLFTLRDDDDTMIHVALESKHGITAVPRSLLCRSQWASETQTQSSHVLLVSRSLLSGDRIVSGYRSSSIILG